MCFSPAASFAASGVLATAAVAIAQKKKSGRELAVAVIPAIFAAQQLLEGVVWLYLYEPGAIRTVAVTAFQSIAYLLWPLYMPLAIFRWETERWRKQAMIGAFLTGAVAASYFLYQMVNQQAGVMLVQGSLQYQMHMPAQIGLFYLIATTLSWLVARDRWLVGTGTLIFLGAVVSGLAYPFAIASIWCYFAAVASLMLAVRYLLLQPRSHGE